MPFIAQAIAPGLIGLVMINFLAKSFWRVLIFNGGAGSTGASEVRFKKGGNTKGGTPLGSGGTPGNAFDADTATNWSVTGEFGEYVGLEFAGGTDIDEIDIVSLFNDAGNTLLDYEVQFSDDGIVWTTVWTSFGNVKPTGNNQTTTSNRPFAPIEGAGLVHQRTTLVMGASPNAMINNIKAYAIHGASADAMVNSIKVYAIYDAGS